MASKITHQQREHIYAGHGQPVPIEDEEGHRVYFLLGADYLHTSREQLKALVQEGINGRPIPATEAELELRSYADQLDRK